MKVPDKIFIHEVSAKKLSEPHADYHLEYIRKDALLEWLLEQKNKAKIAAGGCFNMQASGKFLAYDELIEKLNTM